MLEKNIYDFFFNPKKSVLVITVSSYIYIVLHICVVSLYTTSHGCKHILLHLLAHWDTKRSVK